MRAGEKPRLPARLAMMMLALAIIITAALLRAGPARQQSNTELLRGIAEGRTTWDPAKTPCPCNSTALCQPINHPAASDRQGVYVMHAGFTSPHPGAPDDKFMWSKYDWTQVSTIAVFGVLSAELYCHAHAHGGE
jgi:hypothetical protein